MANIKSSKKRIKVNEAKTISNKAVKSDLKTAIKKANIAAENGEFNDAAATIKKIDKACTKGVIHKNTAARKKSQIAKLANKAEA
ncbi:MAG: 30S ribosomal protein S20 [Clostridiales bacterium]|nr:30S ribosomal protein S20 [Clostridiales bacterium]